MHKCKKNMSFIPSSSIEIKNIKKLSHESDQAYLPRTFWNFPILSWNVSIDPRRSLWHSSYKRTRIYFAHVRRLYALTSISQHWVLSLLELTILLRRLWAAPCFVLISAFSSRFYSKIDLSSVSVRMKSFS